MKSLVHAYALLFTVHFATLGQEIGVDICACQPAVYKFMLDLNRTCDDLNVRGPGVSDTACIVQLRGTDDQAVADLRPVAVKSVQIFELDQSLQVITQTPLAGNFLSGSTFTYTSIVNSAPDVLPPETLPRGLQLVLTGLNKLEQTIVNTFIIVYANDCGTLPVLQEGQIAGWTTFSHLEKPAERLCPSLAIGPSSTPTISKVPSTGPSQSPTISMTRTSSHAPSTPPSLSPSGSFEPSTTFPAPTQQPSKLPSMAPSSMRTTTDSPEETASPSTTSPTSSYRDTTSKRGRGKTKIRNDSESNKQQGKGSSSKSKRGSSKNQHGSSKG